MSQFRDTTLTTAPTVFSYTPTGRAIPASSSLSPLRTPAQRPATPSCTPTGRIVVAAREASSAA